MDVTQIYELTNTVTKEVLGDTAVVNEDLTNVVDIGNAVLDNDKFDNYVKSLVNHIGRVIFVNRKYAGSAPSVLMDSWMYGSILQKISSDLPEAEENESWNLIDGTSYDPNVFRKPSAAEKFFNRRTTFEIDRSITERQVRESFSNAEQLNGFISMIFNEIYKSLTVKMDALIMRTINNFIGECFYKLDSDGTYTGKTSPTCVNLLYLYNQQYDESLTADKCVLDPKFVRFAAYTMGLYADRISRISRLFNLGNQARFTPRDLLHFITLSNFTSAADVFLQSDVYHDNYTKFPSSESVPAWQGSGLAWEYNDVSSIDIKTSAGHTVKASGILGVMFDRDALGVTNLDPRVTTNYNPKAEFTNYFFKQEAGYFNDFNENFVVFFAG